VRLEPALRNPDLYDAGTRVEMVSSVEALAEQLPDDVLSADKIARHEFFARFWAQEDRIRVWLDDEDPPGERGSDVARRFFTFARSLSDLDGRGRAQALPATARRRSVYGSALRCHGRQRKNPPERSPVRPQCSIAVRTPGKAGWS
jgi:hypothetical protein